mmetsp:Transcript_10509/g.29158  ORF Transcript_10509/g.29158 Transcript_10509/m.29158 type:complete len:289 (+) Transcript_10509:183-1049(+)
MRAVDCCTQRLRQTRQPRCTKHPRYATCQAGHKTRGGTHSVQRRATPHTATAWCDLLTTRLVQGQTEKHSARKNDACVVPHWRAMRQRHNEGQSTFRILRGEFSLQIAFISVLFLMRPPNSRHPHFLCRWWEGVANSVGKHCWLVLVRNTLVHHWTVSVPPDVRLETLVHAPGHVANPVARDGPTEEALHFLPESLRHSSRREVDESIPKRRFCTKIHRHINKVVQPFEPLLVEQLNNHVPGVVIWQVLQHDSGASRVETIVFDENACVLGTWRHGTCRRHTRANYSA